MNTKKTYGFILPGLAANALVLCTSMPGRAANPYRQGQRGHGSYVNQHRGATNTRQIETNRRAQEAELAKKVEANNRAQEARKRAQQAEANRRAHLHDHQVQSNGANVQHPDIPQAGVDQKGGVYDRERSQNPDVRHNVGTPRRIRIKGSNNSSRFSSANSRSNN